MIKKYNCLYMGLPISALAQATVEMREGRGQAKSIDSSHPLPKHPPILTFPTFFTSQNSGLIKGYANNI